MLMSAERFLTLRYPLRNGMLKRKHMLYGYVLIWGYSISMLIALKYHYDAMNMVNLAISNIIPLLGNLVSTKKQMISMQTDSQIQEATLSHQKNIVFMLCRREFFRVMVTLFDVSSRAICSIEFID
eukprot:TCONS_00061742-protein